jgi:hypothetical protein
MGILDDISAQANVGMTEDQDSGFARVVGKVLRVSGSGKAIEVDCKGHTSWVPISQINLEQSTMDLEPGSEGALVIPKWLADRMEEEKATGPKKEEPQLDDVRLGNCIVMRETAKALSLRIPGARTEEVWIPKGQIRETSECLYDGDRGTLVISHWIAQEKGLLGISEARGSTATEEPDDDLSF